MDAASSDVLFARGQMAYWGAIQHPVLIAPDLTIVSAAAPAATLRLLVPTLAVGGLLVLPSLYWLMRVFKSRAA